MITILQKSDILDERYLRVCDTQEVRQVMKDCAEKRSESRSWRNGYSKNKNMRMIGDIPQFIYAHPKFRRIFNNPDPIEGQKLRREFLRKYSKFACVDKV